jgi:hypothetical protein
MSCDLMAPGIGLNWVASTAVQYARLGQKISVTLSARCRFTAIFCEMAEQATAALTDIVSWYASATGEILCTVTANTTAYTNYVVGLPITFIGGTAIIATGSRGWVQTSGNVIVTPDGTQVGNGLLGDGSVAAGETLMASAGTDGMVDTWATNAGLAIGRALIDDAPAISTFILNCPAAGAL